MSNGKIIVGDIQDFEFFLNKHSMIKSRNTDYTLVSSVVDVYIPYIENNDILKIFSASQLSKYVKELSTSRNYSKNIFCITNLKKSDTLYNLVHSLIEDTYKVSKYFNFFYHCSSITEILNTRLLDKCTDIIILKTLTAQEKLIIDNVDLFNNKNIVYLNRHIHSNITKSELIKLLSNASIQKNINVEKSQEIQKLTKSVDTSDDTTYIDIDTLIVSNNLRIPPDINSEYTHMYKDEFIERASTDDGININDTLYINIDSLTKNIYNALSYNNDNEFNTIFYMFEDQKNTLDFIIPEGIITYKNTESVSMIKLENELVENHIKRSEFLRLNENDLMFITSPGRMGDEDGCNFIIKDKNEFKLYRIDGWMYPDKKINPYTFISLDDVYYKFPKYKYTLSNINATKISEDNDCTIINDDSEYVYIYMGFGNSLCVKKSIYYDFKLYLDKLIIEYKIKNKDKNGYNSIPPFIFTEWLHAVNLMIQNNKK